MPAIVLRQVDAVELVVGRHDRGADVEDVVLAQVLLIDPERVRRRGEKSLHVVVEFEAIEFAHVLRFGDPEYHALGEAVEAAKHLLRRHLDKIPWADSSLDRFEQRVLADPLKAAKDQAVIDLLVRPLRPVGEEGNDVIGFVWINSADMLDPRLGLRRVAGDRARRAV